MVLRWVCILACAVAACGQSSPGTGLISGSVLDRLTGQPLKGAEVCLSGPDRPCALTEADGRFEFRVPSGRYTLNASRPGYVAGAYTARPEGQETVLAIEPGMRVGDIRLLLHRFSVVSGRAVNEDGEPIEAAKVVVWSLPVRGRTGQPLRGVVSGATNDLGEYRVAGLSPGNYFVSVEPRLPDLPCRPLGSEGKPGFPKRIYGLTFYPGTPDPMEAVPVRVEPGLDLKGIDFTLLPVHAEAVRGSVEMNFEGLSSPAIALERPELAAPPRYAQVNPQDGSFAFCGVLPGRYVLRGSWEKPGKVLHASEEVETGEAPMGDLVVRPSPAAEVAGALTVEGTAKPDLAHLDIALFGDSGNQFTQLKEDRTFVFRDAWPGRYRVELPNPPSCCYLKAMKLRGQDLLRDGFRLEAGESLNGVELVLGADAVNIIGMVLDAGEKPVPGVLAVIEPDLSAAHPGMWGTAANTDQAGGFVLSGVPPGDYRVYAWEDPGGIEWYRPEAISAFRDRGTAVSVPGGAGQPVTVHLITK